MQKDMIDRQAAIDLVTDSEDIMTFTAIGVLRNRLRKLSSAAKEHWLINSDGYYPYCSECKKEPKGGFLTDFCPNCGADMREERRAKNDTTD